jgi:hypothetical protein
MSRNKDGCPFHRTANSHDVAHGEGAGRQTAEEPAVVLVCHLGDIEGNKSQALAETTALYEPAGHEHRDVYGTSTESSADECEYLRDNDGALTAEPVAQEALGQAADHASRGEERL